jgi:hypothetical protein
MLRTTSVDGVVGKLDGRDLAMDVEDPEATDVVGVDEDFEPPEQAVMSATSVKARRGARQLSRLDRRPPPVHFPSRTPSAAFIRATPDSVKPVRQPTAV